MSCENEEPTFMHAYVVTVIVVLALYKNGKKKNFRENAVIASK